MSEGFIQIQPLEGDASLAKPVQDVPRGTGKIAGLDVGSTTCKYSIAGPDGELLGQAYERHNTKQAEKVIDFLGRMEKQYNFTPGQDRVFFTGSGAGLIAPLVGGKVIQEVVAVAAAVEKVHPNVRFVSEIGGEDMKTIFFSGAGPRKSKQVLMQSACSGGTGTFIEKTARKLEIATDQLSKMGYEGYTLHKISSKCGIFAEADSNTLLKAGVSVEEIIASLFEAVVYQNLATLTRGNTPLPEILLLGGPNLFFKGLQEAWRYHLAKLWKERKVEIPDGRDPESFIRVPDDALYYAAQGCIEVGLRDSPSVGTYLGTSKLQWWIDEGQHEEKKKLGSAGLWKEEAELKDFLARYSTPGSNGSVPVAADGNGHTNGNGNGKGKTKEHGRPVLQGKITRRPKVRLPMLGKTDKLGPVVVGCDFGSTTAKAVCMSPDKELLFSCYALSRGNPIDDAKSLFRQVQEAVGDGEILGLAITGYGKDLLKDILGADCPVVETIAHASAGLHYFPDADCICDVGGVDVKIMLLNNGAVTDFRLNSQCSSGNGAFLQGIAERFNIPMSEMADRAFRAQSMPQLSMGCGVFLQSDIVNQQRKGWQAEEILAGAVRDSPVERLDLRRRPEQSDVGRQEIYFAGRDAQESSGGENAGGFHPEKSSGCGRGGASLLWRSGCDRRGAGALDWWDAGGTSKFRGFDAIEKTDV